MKVSTSQMIPMIAMLTVLVIGFQNCGQTRFTQVDGQMSLKAVDENGNLVPMGDDSELANAEVPMAPVAAIDEDDSGFVTPPPLPVEEQVPAAPPVVAVPPVAPPVVAVPPVESGDVAVTPVPTATPKVVMPEEQQPVEDVAAKEPPKAEPTPVAVVAPPKARDIASEDDDKVAESRDDGRSGPCEVLKAAAMPLVIDAAAPDLTSKNARGPLEFDFAKDLIVANHHGPLLVKSAASLKVDNVTGKIQVAANLVNGSNIGGNSCILADKVGSISNIGGGSHIVAREVDSISNSNGNLHIFGARVQKVSNHKGKVCLHDGAVVLEAVNAQVGKCD